MLTLILGGARSGKSRYAQSLCTEARSVIYIATAAGKSDDEEMRTRINRHKAERPATWMTIEESLDLAGAVNRAAPQDAVILVDCITIWLANLLWQHRELETQTREQRILAEVEAFAVVARGREVIAVSNETGSGIVPDNAVARQFRDVQGLANQMLALEAGRVVLVVAGLPLSLKG